MSKNIIMSLINEKQKQIIYLQSLVLRLWVLDEKTMYWISQEIENLEEDIENLEVLLLL